MRPLWGYKRAYDLRYYDVVGDTNFGSSPNTLHDKDAEVTDFFPVDFKIGTDGYGYGFVYRSTRSNPSDGLADVFLDFWSSEEDGTAFGRTGKVVMSGVSPTAQMDVQVFGRLVYVFIAGRSPAMFFVKVTSEKKYIATASTWLNEDIVLETKADRVAVDPLLDRVMDLDNQTEARGHGLIRFDCSDEVGLTLVSAKMECQVKEALFDDVTYKFARSVPAWEEDDASGTNFSA
ncbi:MAG: hypothetical protein IIC57_08245, partial [Proteobacteria bacterium]|nr:hypothetical protein [Pseudomonadota bacterium]